MSQVPNHVGIIMDGNRRWAKENGLSARQGHAAGQENLRAISKAAFESGVKTVSAYAFSSENWQRTKEEIGHLMKLLVRGVDKYMDEFNSAGVKVIFLGERDNLDDNILKAIEKAEQKTKHNAKGTLAICFNYGGRQELVEAAKKMITNNISSEDVTEDLFASYLYQPQVPAVDLLIRTSGEQRLSNFMLWRVAYSELYFVDKHWPDFTPEDLQKAINEYAHRGRRFGV